MKKIIIPEQKEEAVYFSDFTGKPFEQFGAPVELKFEFNYGSKYDNYSFTLHLDDKDIQPILDLIKSKVIDSDNTVFLQEYNSF
jgi:hypothetical protein